MGAAGPAVPGSGHNFDSEISMKESSPGDIPDASVGHLPQPHSTKTARILLAGILSLLAFGALQILPSDVIPRNADTMARAATIMQQAIQAIREAREHDGSPMDLGTDPNRTGLIGPEYSPLVTTLGDLEAKRTSTNPNMAGYIVYLLDRAGVKPGDSVALGSSGSFPSLLVASLSAAKAMDVHPVTILSLGASSYGASDPEFNILDIYQILKDKGICPGPPAAVSLGGEKDCGSDFEPEIRARLRKKIEAAGLPYLEQASLPQNVSDRWRIYGNAASGKIAAFINSGGGYANLGTSSLVLDVKPGLSRDLVLPSAEERGMLFEMAAHHVPVIHLLFVKGLATQAGLPWDPIPLPEPAVIHPPGAGRTGGFWAVTGIYFGLLIVLATCRRRDSDGRTDRGRPARKIRR
jgi:poly-gamma-glutamate system protein